MLSEQEKRLDDYEKMHKAVIIGLEDAEQRMAALQKKGKSRTATYKQLMVQKITYKNMLDMYRLFGVN